MKIWVPIKILFVCAALLAAAQARASVLWWETNDPEDIEVELADGTTTDADTWRVNGMDVNGVRIRVNDEGDGTYPQTTYFDDATGKTYLQMAYMDENGNIVVGHTKGTTVVAVPTYDIYAYLGPDGAGYDNASYSFTVELGNWANGTWTMLAESDTAVCSTLAGHISPSGGGLDVPTALPWFPEHFHVVPVPEPGTTLLIVIGCAILALRRRPAI